MATYNGNAKIVSIDGREIRWTDGLTDEQIENAMNIVITVKPEDENYAECEVEVEISERECKGKLAGKKQTEVSLSTLHKAQLIRRADIDALEELFPGEDGKGGCIGKTVSVYQKETVKTMDDGTKKTYVNTYLSNGAVMSRSEINSRLARLRGIKSAKANPFD